MRGSIGDMGARSFTAKLPETSGPLLETRVTLDYFMRFIAANPDLRTELTAEGEMIVLPPAFSDTGEQNSEIAVQLGMWARRDKRGKAYDSSTGFTLPNGAIRSPDASWILISRLASLTGKDRSGFKRICPDFVVELRSTSDRLPTVRAKLEEYLANGAKLGWLIDPKIRTVHIYRPLQRVQVLEDAVEVAADPELPGFVLDLKPIFNPEL